MCRFPPALARTRTFQRVNRGGPAPMCEELDMRAVGTTVGLNGYPSFVSGDLLEPRPEAIFGWTLNPLGSLRAAVGLFQQPAFRHFDVAAETSSGFCSHQLGPCYASEVSKFKHITNLNLTRSSRRKSGFGGIAARRLRVERLKTWRELCFALQAYFATWQNSGKSWSRGLLVGRFRR